jgi:2-phospho-L-lactate guanylyltransferase
VVPVKDLAGTKSRLAPVLNPGARAGLTLYMMGRVVRALREAGVGDVCVVSPDPIVLNEALGRGAVPLLQRSQGLNPALEEGRARALAADASTLLVLPADCRFSKRATCGLCWRRRASDPAWSSRPTAPARGRTRS